MSRYRCKHCGKVVERDSNKAWVKSWCDKTQRDVHLTRVKNNG
jgi:phage FluMu protein Com